MKIVQKLTLVLFTLIICQIQLTATSLTHFNYNFVDTIPQIEPEYNGNRILVKSIKVIKKKGKSYKIEYKLVNNGRNKIKLGKASSIPTDLIIQFDKSLEENDLVDARLSIIESIKKQSISIRPGQLIMGNKIKFTHRPIPPSDRIAIESETPTQENVKEQIIVENEIIENKDLEIIKKEVPLSKFDEAVKDIVEEVPLPDAELENPRTLEKTSLAKEEIKTIETPLDETILVKEKNPSRKLGIDVTEPILEDTPNENEEINVEEVVEINTIEEILPSENEEIYFEEVVEINIGEEVLPSKNEEVNVEEIIEVNTIEEISPTQNEEIDVEEVVEINIGEEVLPSEIKEEIGEVNIGEEVVNLPFLEPTEKEETEIAEVVKIIETENLDTILSSKLDQEIVSEFVPEEMPLEEIPSEEIPEIENSDEKLCADLIIENVEVVKKNKRYVFVKYTIKNIGNIPISLHGATKNEFDNIAIQSHFTRSHNLTRGSIPVDISFIKKGKKDIKGMLVPGESVSLKLKVETLKVTKFTPVLALTLNPSAANFECNRSNNLYFIDIAEKAPEAINSVPKKPSDDVNVTAEKMTTLEN